MVRNPTKARQAGTKVAVPRTHGEAKSRGFKTATAAYGRLNDDQKAEFVTLSKTNARAGAMGSIGTDPNDPSHWLVCYLKANKQCHWVSVPKSAPVPDEDPDPDGD